jgi:glucose/arabinose dehydrogenase
MPSTPECSRAANRFALIAGLLALLTLASACAGAPAATPTVAVQPAATEAPAEQATGMPEATPTSEPTALPETTETAEASATSTATAEVTAAPEATTTVAATEVVTATATGAAPDLSGIGLQEVAGGLTGPLWVTHASDGSGRLFVLEKPGVIRIIADGQLSEQPFLDISDRVGSSASEQGLLGLAFAPDYVTSGFFFVNYTNKNGDTVISRFNVGETPDAADPNSEFLVLSIDQPAANHNGGDITFGPDGMLWIGMGDGGAANDRFGNGQNPATLLGKMLRIDVTSDPSQPYVIPEDNPWVQNDWNGEDVADEVWAVGVRNPWRFSFDRANGDLWIADVGQNQYEEVHYVAANTDGKVQGGLNFGWPMMEGLHCFSEADCQQEGLEIPVAEYDHSEGCSVTGGYVYRGETYPALTGVYVFGDYCSGTIWALHKQGDNWERTELLRTDYSISSFGEDEAGELYVTDLRGGGVYRIVVE